MNQFGWVNDPAAVEVVCMTLQEAGHVLRLSQAAASLFGDDDNRSVFLWDAEQAVLGTILACQNQNPVGSCVGFGATRAAQDTLLNEIASGEPEVWPGAELAAEITYILSRCEVNGGRSPIRPSRQDRYGDGSVGAWAAKALIDYGVVKRDRYGDIDLTTYDPAWVRENQFHGVPASIETIAKQHPITTAARLESFADVWAAIGARKGCFMCSVIGFDRVDADGVVVRTGRWGHCMSWRGRVNHRRGRMIVVQNQWRGGTGNQVLWPGPNRLEIETLDRGRVLLPEGCALMPESIIEAICREQDSFSTAGLSGWKRLKLTMEPF